MDDTRLYDRAVYVNLTPERLRGATRGRALSLHITEKKRWVQAKKLLQMADQEGRRLAVLFGDSRYLCTLEHWAILRTILVSEDRTAYQVTRPVRIRDHEATELIVCSTSKPLVADFRRSYVIVETPDFLRFPTKRKAGGRSGARRNDSNNPGAMKVVGIRQPLAWAVANGRCNVIDCPERPPNSIIDRYVAIRAGSYSKEAAAHLRHHAMRLGQPLIPPAPAELERDKVIGLARVEAIIEQGSSASVSTWLRGRFGIQIRDFRPAKAVACPNGRGVWTLPTKVRKKLLQTKA